MSSGMDIDDFLDVVSSKLDLIIDAGLAKLEEQLSAVQRHSSRSQHQEQLPSTQDEVDDNEFISATPEHNTVPPPPPHPNQGHPDPEDDDCSELSTTGGLQRGDAFDYGTSNPEDGQGPDLREESQRNSETEDEEGRGGLLSKIKSFNRGTLRAVKRDPQNPKKRHAMDLEGMMKDKMEEWYIAKHGTDESEHSENEDSDEWPEWNEEDA